MSDKDGSFLIEYRSGLAYLTVNPPGGGGRPVYREDVINRMKILGVSTVCADTVAETVNRSDGIAVELIAWPRGGDLMSKVEIAVATDLMSATLKLSGPKKGGGVPPFEEIKDQLTRAGVVWGIDENSVTQALESGTYDADIPVASGRVPKGGLPERATFSFVHDPGKPYVFREDGSVDLKELNFIQNRKTKDVLATLLPAEEPVPGMNVLGQEIPPPPMPRKREIAAGENASFSKSGNTIVALVDGNAYLKGNAVCVEPVVSVARVDYETGNIRFEGSVVVTGSVADGFVVEAGGAVEIGECLGRATVQAGRDVLLRGGMNGDGEGTVRAGGSIRAKYIENARVSCAGDLIVDELLMHTDFVTEGDLIMRGRRGEYLGGNGVVGGNLWCKQLGSPSEVPTRISIGIEPARLNTYILLKKALENQSLELDEVNRTIAGLKNAGKERETKKYREALVQLKEKAVMLEASVRDKKKQFNIERAKLVPRASTIAVIQGAAYGKSVVAFGEEEFRVTDSPARKTVLTYSGGKISEGGFNPSEPPKFPHGATTR
jgi:uncharacterized protein